VTLSDHALFVLTSIRRLYLFKKTEFLRPQRRLLFILERQ
jgi:hypothetical protein